MKPSRNPTTEIVGLAFSRWMVTVAVFNFVAVTVSLHWVWPQITRTDEATYFDIGPLCFGVNRTP